MHDSTLPDAGFFVGSSLLPTYSPSTADKQENFTMQHQPVDAADQPRRLEPPTSVFKTREHSHHALPPRVFSCPYLLNTIPWLPSAISCPGSSASCVLATATSRAIDPRGLEAWGICYVATFLGQERRGGLGYGKQSGDGMDEEMIKGRETRRCRRDRAQPENSVSTRPCRIVEMTSRGLRLPNGRGRQSIE